VQEAEQDPDGGALARAVRPQEAEDLARPDIDGQVLEGDDLGTLATQP
jgi:hypothetical protein